MPEFQVLWTALPRGATTEHLLVDVFVSPRLGVNAPATSSFTLADFDPFADWPAELAAHLSFEIELEPGAPVPAARIPLSPSESAVDLDSASWTHLFPSTTPVEPWTRRSASNRPLYSFPADMIADYLQKAYRTAGQTSPISPIDNDALGGLIDDLGDLIDTRLDAERPEPTSHTTGGETIGGGPAATSAKVGCLQGCLTAPIAWFVWLLRSLWNLLTGKPPPSLTIKGPEPPPISVTPKVVTYEFPHPPPAAVPPALAAVEQHVAATGVTPGAGWSPPGSPLTPDQVAFAAGWRFYRRPESQPPAADKPDLSLVPPGPTAVEWDFHRRLGPLGDYPLLLRRLGLVVRLRVPRPATAPTSVRVIPQWDGQRLPNRDLTPRTRCRLDADRFLAESRPGSDLKDGAIDLTNADAESASPSGYRLVVTDVDGAMLKLVHTAASLLRFRALRNHGLVRNASRPEGLAALRSAGIAITRTGRAHALKAQLAYIDTTAPAAQQNAPTELFADDIARGFRVEVQDTDGPNPQPWRSLCKRSGTYYLLDDTGTVLTSFALDDHGYVKRSAATSADNENSPLYLHETLVRWSGWSLVAPRPGRRIRPIAGTRPEDGRVVPTQDEEAVPPVPEPQADLHLATAFRPQPGTLPKLRFGRSYRFRLPWVDLAGEAADSSPAVPVSAALTYRRFEPLAPPALLPQQQYSEGESLETLVIRSDLDRDAGSYVQHVLHPLASHYSAIAKRHVFPAKTSQHDAEQHGNLDNHPLDWSWRASLRADHTFNIHTFQGLDDPNDQVVFGEPDTVVIESTTRPPDPKQTYAINRADETLTTPYLPDPLNAGVALRALPGADALQAAAALSPHAVPGTTEIVCHVPFAGNWPELASFRLSVTERPGTVDPSTGIETFTHPADPPQWDAAKRILTVSLGKAEVATVAYSTPPTPAKLDWLGTADWLNVTPGSALEETIRLGCHWMISPARLLTLVHAVQHPLAAAALTSAQANKNFGATVATISGRMKLHPESTGQVTLLAAWTDELDDGHSPTLVKTAHETVLDTFKVPLPLAEGSAADTPFPPALPAADTATPVPARHEFGDPKHRLVRYRFRSSTRFREYFPAALEGTTAADGSDGFSRVGDELVVSIPNSVPPDAAHMRYLVPSFGWDTPDPASPTSWTAFKRVRRGGAIRVFLDRPWFTSGPGEQLGVVVARAGKTLPDTIGTQIGADPTWSNLFTPPMPAVEATLFSGGDVHHDIQLEDGTLVDIVGFHPTLDVERNQWYADVTLDTNTVRSTYWPFIRLALVRFQPSSIPRAGASKIVLAEFTQLAPDRTLEVEVVGNNINVTVRGSGPLADDANLMLVSLDEADSSDPDELAWRPVTATAATPSGHQIEARLADAVAGVREPSGSLRWERTISMPGPRGDRTLRVIAYELELRETDEDVIQERFADLPLDNPIITNLIRTRRLPRIVYADTVRLA